MPRKPKSSDSPAARGSQRSDGVSLKQLAAHLNLSTTTLSLVLNDAPTAGSIPQGLLVAVPPSFDTEGKGTNSGAPSCRSESKAGWMV